MTTARQQIDALTELHAKPWEPGELAGFHVGDVVTVASLGRCTVIELLPPALLLLRTGTGAEVKCGWRACTKQKEKHCNDR